MSKLLGDIETQMYNDMYWLSTARQISLRSKCQKRRVGAIIIDENDRVIATGYNFHPRGTSQDSVCLRKDIPSGESMDHGYCVHAEENAMIFANFDEMQGATLYVTHAPCRHCALLIIQAGIGELVYYKDKAERKTGISLFKELGSSIKIRGYDANI